MYAEFGMNYKKRKEVKKVGKIKVGVIGAGSISEMHFGSYQNNNDVEIHAVCDSNEQRTQEKATKYGAEKCYKNYQDLLADPEIEAVSICTWNNSHAEISIAALHAGKHVLVEKPLCKTVEEAYEIEKAAKANNEKVF